MEYYSCSRSGQHSTPSKMGKKVRLQTGYKVGFSCSAHVTARVDDLSGVVSVSACLTHYGHDHDLARLHMPKAVWDMIVDLHTSG